MRGLVKWLFGSVMVAAELPLSRSESPLLLKELVIMESFISLGFRGKCQCATRGLHEVFSLLWLLTASIKEYFSLLLEANNQGHHVLCLPSFYPTVQLPYMALTSQKLSIMVSSQLNRQAFFLFSSSCSFSSLFLLLPECIWQTGGLSFRKFPL